VDELVVIDARVRSHDRDAVVALRVERHGAQPVELGHVRIVVRDVGARIPEERENLLRGRFAHVADVGLVRDADEEDLRAFERALRAVVQRLGDDRAAEVRHVVVDLAGKLDEARVEVELARLPREVVRVERDAVAAETRPGLEGHEPERLRRGGADHFPDVDVHAVAQLRELVHERDVHRAEDVLEQLRQLGGLGGRHLVDVVERAPVQRSGGPCRLGVEPSDDLRRRLRRPVRPARIDALRREGEMEVGAGLQPAARLEQRLQHLAGRARIGGRLEDDEMALRQMRRDVAGGALDVAQVRLALGREWRGNRDDDGGAVADDAEIGRRRYEPGVDEPFQIVGMDVLDVALAAVDPVDDRLLDVDENDALACVGERLRMRHADVAGPDDRDLRIHAAARLAATRAAAAPSPYSCGRSFGIRAEATAATSSAGSSSTRTFAPASTVSTHSVDGLVVTQGTPYQYASFWSPPESVTMTRACEQSAAMSR